MTNEEPGPAPDHGLSVAVRVLLSPDGKRVAVAIPADRSEPTDRREHRIWFAVDPDPVGTTAPVAFWYTDDEVRDWHPVIDLDELRGHIGHWRATGPDRRHEFPHPEGSSCCFPEALGTVASDLEDYAETVREWLWRE